MSDLHGGFYIMRDDAALAASVLELVRDYLGDTDQSDEVQIVWSGRVGVGALFMTLTRAESHPTAWSRDWVAANLAFGGRVAREACAPTWAYTYDNIEGTESVARFDGGGALSHQKTTDWADGILRALTELTDELAVPRVLVEYDMPFATPTFVQSLDEELDVEAFEVFLAARPAVVWPHNADFVVLHLPTNAAEELEAAAAKLTVRPGDLINAMWEACKPEIFGSIPLIERDHLEGPEAYLTPPPSRATDVKLTGNSNPPPLDPDSPKKPVRLALAPDTIREMQELALAGDRSQSYVLQRTLSIGRRLL